MVPVKLNMTSRCILHIQMGGTIDKCYPKTRLGYSFEIGEPAVERILRRCRCNKNVISKVVCRKDSQDITDEDRQAMVDLCKSCEEDKILITHGTDTLLDSARHLHESNVSKVKVIVITGAFLPEAFKDTDADFNVGVALGALQCLKTPGVFVSMNGEVNPWSKVCRHPETNMFVVSSS